MGKITFKKKLFGENILITLYDVEESLAGAIFEEAYTEALRLQKIFNFYDKGSELSKLNLKRKLKVSSELLEVIKEAINISNATNGKYDISLGKLIQNRKKGENEENLNCSFKDIFIKGNEITLTNPDVLIDLGSIAKGYIVDSISEFLISKGILQGLVDGRGDIRVFGENEEIIGIQHPRENNRLISSIAVINKAVATSGDYNQYQSSFEKSHIINQKDAISITVVAENLMVADAYATALFVSNKREREKMLKKNKRIQAMVIDKKLNLNYSNGFEKNIAGDK